MPEVPFKLQALLDCLVVCEYQLRVTSGGAFALDYASVARVADDFGIKTNTTFYRIIKSFESVLIKEFNKKQGE